jgi:hypothetical protein
MRVRTTPSGREQFGAWREGEHDDLVLAVAPASWGGKQFYPGDWGGDAGDMQWGREAPSIRTGWNRSGAFL